MLVNAQVNSDTSRIIQIVTARSMRMMTLNNGGTIQMLAGNAIVRQGQTTLSGDSIAFNPATGIAEVFGNVHINDADSVHTYAQYLRYIGAERIAYLKRNVKFTDGKGTLFTNELEYNLQTGVANYKNGGRVVNGSTVLTSRDAVYYSDTKDVYFKKNVHLTDPKYDITADSLLYNTQIKTATFISPTHIISKSGVINTRSGTYNLETGEALFYDQTEFSDSTHFASGRTIAIDEKSGMVNIEGNGKLVDSVNKVIVLGDQIFLDRKKNSFLATRKPIMILYQKNDSTYISADTLFSGLRMYEKTEVRKVNKNTNTTKTTTTQATPFVTDSMQINSELKLSDTINIIKDSSVNISTANVSSPDSIRYFIAFHNVKIFNDSMQAVSDSLYYSTEDSVFRLFQDPVFWNDKTQVSGDTMYLFTANKKPRQLNVFNNSLVINKPEDGIFNQVSGRTLNGYFIDGSIDNIRVKGSPAESVYYPQDEDSAYIGMNKSSGDVIDIFFINKELNKIKFVNNVNGTLYPIKQIPGELKLLKGFKWLDARRPKNKLDLFL
ncbi:MAG: OstA-like protein [Ferruginibacter sp.]